MSIASLSREQLAALLKVAKADSHRNWLILHTGWRHGLRASEAISITAEQVCDGYLTVQRLKGSLRTCQPCSQELSEFARGKTGRLFNIQRRQLDNIVKHYAKLAGIPRHLAHSHACFKHTAAVLGLEGGMKIPELQAYLGHVSGSSTLQYLKVSEDAASKAFERAVGGL